MKKMLRVIVTSRTKSKKKRNAKKSDSSTSIAQRYMEVRRLRERISEAESRTYAQ